MTTGHADHVGRNRTHWDRLRTEYAEWAPRAWAGDEATWGIWRLPERDLRALPKVAGKDVVELGCDTAYWSAYLARRGARVVGLDNSWCQLETARALRRTHGSTSRSFAPTRSGYRCAAPASMSPCPSTAPASGATPTLDPGGGAAAAPGR